MTSEGPSVYSAELMTAVQRDAAYFARHRANGRLAADDLAQDGYLAIAEARAKRSVDDGLARIVARRRMINVVSAARRRRSVNATELSLEQTPDAASLDLAAIFDVRDTVAKLSPTHRQALLTTLDGEPHETHADAGLSLTTLWGRLTRARRAARSLLGPGYEHMEKRFSKRYGRFGRAHERKRRLRQAKRGK